MTSDRVVSGPLTSMSSDNGDEMDQYIEKHLDQSGSPAAKEALSKNKESGEGSTSSSGDEPQPQLAMKEAKLD